MKNDFYFQEVSLIMGIVTITVVGDDGEIRKISGNAKAIFELVGEPQDEERTIE